MEFREDSTSNNTKEELTELLISNETSLFRSCYLAQRDTMRYHPDAGLTEPTFPISGNYHRIVKNSQAQSIAYYQQLNVVNGELYRYTESMEDLNWELLPDTMSIGSLKCQKAKINYGNRKWEAWFCPDIAISDGPYKFCNLPGLIVQVADTTDSWSFSLVGIHEIPPFDFDLRYLNQSVEMDKLDFYKHRKEFMANAVDRMLAAGVISFPDPATEVKMRKKSEEGIKQRNNPIELYPQP